MIPSSPKSLSKDYMSKFIDNPFFTPVHSYTFDYGATFSDVYQSHLFALPRPNLISSYFGIYQPFIDNKMIFDRDIERLNLLEKAINQILLWDRFERATPEILLTQFLQDDKHYLLSCLFAKEQLNALQQRGFTDDFILRCAEAQITKRSATECLTTITNKG
ncbi:hypothetical protein RFI_22866 [Reticulomyxa filosa]|uniref:Uncharacterized protein n=1 Tax=Reticulomyxa filosa TaxID=46433 RepID=X6MLI8_RETFI|nr:hypothetical protein RFI_22866 [Reticulomyxa filosa]|eukprot:ETO14506.1 hypothetical protein RFI_22866 [Reticulomyxa filosa]